MVRKGLAVGDVFEDGGQDYLVLSVLENGNYISKRVEKSVDVPTECTDEKTEVEQTVEEKTPVAEKGVEKVTEKAPTAAKKTVAKRTTTKGRK